MSETPVCCDPYFTGLRLAGRSVVVVGAGAVALRRLPALLDAGAKVTVIAPEALPAVETMATGGRLTWLQRQFVEGDLQQAWYVMAVTDDSAVNATVAAEADRLRIFCVRADDSTGGSAVTPATGTRGDVRVGVLTGMRNSALFPGSHVSDGSTPLGAVPRRDPRRAARLRDHLLDAVTDDVRLPKESAVRRPEAAVDQPAQVGSVTLVGGGPGAPDLITVRGREALSQADVVVVDRLAPLDLLSGLAEDTLVVDASKVPRGRHMPQEAINDCLVRQALAGKQVVRLKGGDPFLFGRGSEEVAACTAAGVPVTVVPGVCSALSVPGLAGIPLTERGVAHEVTIVSGHLPPGHPRSLVNWSALAKLRGTIAVLMGVHNLQSIARELIASGRPTQTPVAVVCDGSLASSRTITGTLGSIDQISSNEKVAPPAVIVIGEVVSREAPDGESSGPFPPSASQNE